MEQVPALTDAEIEVLRTVLRMQSEPIAQSDVIASLQARGYVRPDGDEWMITIAGHMAYLRALAATF